MIGSTGCTACEPETASNKEGTKCEKLSISNITLKTATGITIIIVNGFHRIYSHVVSLRHLPQVLNTPIVKASNREISFLLLCGILALFILAVLDLSEHRNLLCIAAICWHCFALNPCVTVLFTKTMRITNMFEVDKIGQLFTPCYKTLLRQTTFIGVVNVVQISLLFL